MIYWILFHAFLVALLILHRNESNAKRKRILEFIILFFLVYFSGYRGGLGADYENYLHSIEVFTPGVFVFGFSEPLYALLEMIVNITPLSPIFLFLISAFFTNVGICNYLFKKNEFALFAILIYVLLPASYTMSFNIVRQFFAVGLFFMSLRYVGVSFAKYSAFILLATLMHFSAIVLLPFYWLLRIKMSNKKMIAVAAIFFLVLPIAISFLSGSETRYAEEASSSDVSTSSGVFLVFNLFFLLFITNRNKYKDLSIINQNLFIWYILMIDASYVNYFFYRLSVYFCPIMALVIPYLLYKLDKKNALNSMFIVFLFVLQYYILLSNVNDSTVVPNNIYPILSIFDSFYES